MIDDEPRSPCKSICKMDRRLMTEQGSLCAGCFRTIDEIAQWSRFSPAEQREVLRQLPERKRQFRNTQK